MANRTRTVPAVLYQFFEPLTFDEREIVLDLFATPGLEHQDARVVAAELGAVAEVDRAHQLVDTARRMKQRWAKETE